ncbi:MAG: hypothetical protein ABSA15_06645 [Thermoplasmata archaeon]|jgi:hypothetical protein
MREWERYLPEITITVTIGLATVASLAVYSSYGIVTWAFSVIWGLATLSSVSLFFAVRRSGEDWHKELRNIFLIGLVLGIVSIFTGLGNNGTDEPYSMGGYLSEFLHGQDPYTTHLVLNYQVHVLNVWSSPVTSSSYYTYLPLLLFIQFPGTGVLGYELMCLGFWAGLVYVVRNDEFAALSLASPVVALTASNGFNDLPVLFLITLSLRGWTGPKAKIVEYATYGLKQFANVFWIVYYILKRDTVQCLLVVVISLAITIPFLVWDPLGIWCQALAFSIGPSCAGQPNSARQLSDLYSHWNYYLWILWVYVLFRGWIHRMWRRWGVRLHRASVASDAVPVLPESP